MKELHALGANIELVETDRNDKEAHYAYTVLYQGERRHGWFDAPVGANDEWLGLWSLLKANFDDQNITNAVLEMLGKSMENATPNDITRLVYSL